MKRLTLAAFQQKPYKTEVQQLLGQILGDCHDDHTPTSSGAPQASHARPLTGIND